MDIHLLHTRDYKIPLLYRKALGSSSSPKSSFNTLTRHFNLSVFYVWCHLIQVFLYLYQVPETPGTPLADFLIFSPRWDIASHTFRPPVRIFRL